MAIAFISNTKASASATSSATTSSADTSGADLLIAVVCLYSTSAAAATVSDNKSNTWSHLSNYVSGNSNVTIFYAHGANVGTGHTFTVNPNGSGYPLIMVSWWSGSANPPIDTGIVNGSGAASTSVSTGNATPSQDNCLVITGLSNNSATNQTVSAPFTRQDGSLNSSFETGAWAYEIQTTATTRNATWTTSLDTSDKSAIITSFLASGGSPPPASTQQLLMMLGCGS